MRTLVWFRGKDLRVSDHAPLRAAVADGEVIPLFVVDPHFFLPARAQGLPHRMQFLLESLVELQSDLGRLGSELQVVSGRSVEVVPRLAHQWKVDRVLAQRWVEPLGRERDRRVGQALQQQGIAFETMEGETLLPPGSVVNQQGAMYRVFTPFSRACRATLLLEPPRPAPRQLPPLPPDVVRTREPLPTLERLGMARNPRLPPGGARAAQDRLARFLEEGLAHYEVDRDRMDREGTSRLSADLKFGTLSVRSVWSAVAAKGPGPSVERFLNELLWREFSHHLLWHQPALLDAPFRPEFQGFPWLDDPTGWEAWTEGRTGFPVVDAAARQLRAEGFVHNRARMVAASFLAKDLMLDYRLGERHYLTWLTDGDWAQNNAGWQWCAGCGCDAQPWFRIFNPTAQGLRFDPEGGYVRRWLPELASCPAEHLHEPWKLSRSERARLDYPGPVVDHASARARFLAVAKAHLHRPGT